MKKFCLSVVSGLCLTGLILSAGCKKEEPSSNPTGKSQSQQSQIIKIGAVLPLTGSMASYGANAKDGIQLAVSEENARAQNDSNLLKIELTVEDSQGEPQMAVSAFQKLLNVNKVTCVIGDVGSSATLAMAPIAGQQHVLLFSPAASSPTLTGASEFFFRDWPSDAFEASVMVDYLKRKQFKTVSLVLLNNDYGQAMLQTVKKGLEGSGVEIVASEFFLQDVTDLRAQITKAAEPKPDVIYLISYPKDSIVFLRQYAELGITIPVVSTSSFEDASILANQAKAAEGVVFTSPMPPGTNDQAVVAFRANYTKTYAKEPGLVADYAYDALNLLVEAAKLGGGASGEQLKMGLAKIKDFHGASGLINFDKNGDVIKPAGLKTVKDGKYVWLD
jgi:branched-chain amino acid transport system substrate-binding protein